MPPDESTLRQKDKYPGAVTTFSDSTEWEIVDGKSVKIDERPPYWLYITTLWIIVCAVVANAAYEHGWNERQKEIEQAQARARSVEFPLDAVVKP